MRARVTTLIASAALLVSNSATAQFDINPPLPNVLLLVDSSGSMEYLPAGGLPKNCQPNKKSDMNRWASLVSVLTGSVNNRSCYAQKRSSSAFINEYGWGGVRPYDAGYFLPHHRILSNGCTAGPGTEPSKIYDFPFDAIAFHPYDQTGAECDSGNAFDQRNDGLMDAFRDRVRFGLMTFDSKTHAGTGISGGSVDSANGMQGLWSYYLNEVGAGNPPKCAAQTFEVGARNRAAPPWEGRLINPGAASASLSEIHATNQNIQMALLAMRPYGATPLAGLLQDAYDFIRNDKAKDPITGKNAAIAGDGLFTGGCRETFVILLSDGEPNLDLRPHCTQMGGSCPYAEPYEIAKKLRDESPAVKTFSVGFGLSSSAKFDCSTITKDDFVDGKPCFNAKGPLKACCTMARIAFAGDTGKAFFAEDSSSLQSSLAEVLGTIAQGSTSRTLPVFSSTVATTETGTENTRAYEFQSSLNPSADSLWSGNLQRKRTVCETENGVIFPKVADIDEQKGADFAANVNKGKMMRPRVFMTVIPNKSLLGSTTVRRPMASVRPHLDGDDGGGMTGGTFFGGALNKTVDDIASKMGGHPELMGVSPMPDKCTAANLAASKSSTCAEKVMKWEVGGNTSGLPSRQGNEFGAIYHSTPAVVGPPGAYLRSESYLRFAAEQAKRPSMLYTATVDGQLHAMKVASNDPDDKGPKVVDLENNELWSFFPPYVLPGIISQYPATQQILLDGAPVVQDVIYSRNGGHSMNAKESWNTVLVASGGAGGGFYYALDVTSPTQPTFLWQLSKTKAGTSLFGSNTGRPALATILYAEPNKTVVEVAVAVLPGGTDPTALSPGCTRDRLSGSHQHIDSNFKPRGKVRCWSQTTARSLTIVRLSDGKILKSFYPKGHAPSELKSQVVQAADFDSPISGDPVPYPAGPGKVADRVYVGDADGTLWYIDLANSDPDKWAAHIAWDAYSMTGDDAEDGQPIMTPPVVSVDGFGNTVLLFSTGDQELFSTVSDMTTRVWSLLEVPEAKDKAPFQMTANWVESLEGGKRVTGPIALFDGVAYFSTFTPQLPGKSACSDGFGSLWGVDFLERVGMLPKSGPLPRLYVDNKFVKEEAKDPGTVVFGVAVTQVPTCFQPQVVSDTYIGKHTALGNYSAPQFQLVVQTGAIGKKSANSKTNTLVKQLPDRASRVSIDSWATVMQ